MARLGNGTGDITEVCQGQIRIIHLNKLPKFK